MYFIFAFFQVRKLREENRKLAESNEEMQAASLLNRGLEQGKTLLSNYDAAPSSSMSIADELGGMSDFQVRQHHFLSLVCVFALIASLHGYIVELRRACHQRVAFLSS